MAKAPNGAGTTTPDGYKKLAVSEKRNSSKIGA